MLMRCGRFTFSREDVSTQWLRVGSASQQACMWSRRRKSFTSIASQLPNPTVSSLNLVAWSTNKNNNNNNNKDLTIEIQRMWNVKTKAIPVIIGATGTTSKSFRKYVSNIPGKHEVKELQKTAILGTAHILRKVLM